MKRYRIYTFFAFLALVVIALILKPIIGIILTFAFIIWCFKYLIKPLNEINEQLEKFSSGLSRAESSSDPANEVKRALDEFENLLENFEEIKQRFETFLKLSTNAIAILDERGRIKFSNEKFESLFSGFERGKQSFYWEVIRNFELNQLIKQLIEMGSKSQNFETSKEIELGRKNYLAIASKNQRGEIFITLNDITSEKELSEIKRELVENISHEFKTPLSNIKGYIETIEEELQKLGRKNRKVRDILGYIEPVKRNTDRLVRIINDLLILSGIESGVKFEEEKIDFEGLIYGILRMYERSLKEKGLYCEVKVSKELPEFWGDVYRIEQMFSNLIDNAIKYTDRGGIKIKVEPERERERIKITIEDTGIGIPKEHLPRIFERFYVVDKSRSRQSGGTGLGLSIVKHVVLMYNGSINVESKVGAGTRFEIYLPVRKPLQKVQT